MLAVTFEKDKKMGCLLVGTFFDTDGVFSILSFALLVCVFLLFLERGLVGELERVGELETRAFCYYVFA
jgi:hypothetical protein